MNIIIRQVTGGKAKSGAVVKHQRKRVVLKTTSNVRDHFKSGFVPLYRSLVTSLYNIYILYSILVFSTFIIIYICDSSR